MQSTPVNVSASGDNVLIAADPSGRAIAVLGLLLVAAAPVTVQLFSDTSSPVALTGPMTLAAGVPLSLMPGDGMDVVKLMQAAPGKALNLRLSAGVQVGGFLLYDLF